MISKEDHTKLLSLIESYTYAYSNLVDDSLYQPKVDEERAAYFSLVEFIYSITEDQPCVN